MPQTSSFVDTLKADLPASVVVFLVAVPLCLGIALASGAPLFSGIIAGIVGGIVVGALSGSALGVSGPAAGLAVIVLTSITGLGSFRTFLLSVVLAGVIQLALGFARAGVIGYYFPSSVIKGMLTGIGLTIILKQLPHAAGTRSPASRRTQSPGTRSALGSRTRWPSRITHDWDAAMAVSFASAASERCSWYKPRAALSNRMTKMAMASIGSPSAPS